ncbi:hypothetical protein ACSSS7_005392 [Eimeria intestinalis]
MFGGARSQRLSSDTQQHATPAPLVCKDKETKHAVNEVPVRMQQLRQQVQQQPNAFLSQSAAAATRVKVELQELQGRFRVASWPDPLGVSAVGAVYARRAWSNMSCGSNQSGAGRQGPSKIAARAALPRMQLQQQQLKQQHTQEPAQRKRGQQKSQQHQI